MLIPYSFQVLWSSPPSSRTSGSCSCWWPSVRRTGSLPTRSPSAVSRTWACGSIALRTSVTRTTSSPPPSTDATTSSVASTTWSANGFCPAGSWSSRPVSHSPSCSPSVLLSSCPWSWSGGHWSSSCSMSGCWPRPPSIASPSHVSHTIN